MFWHIFDNTVAVMGAIVLAVAAVAGAAVLWVGNQQARGKNPFQ